jgi:hypothetical protein
VSGRDAGTPRLDGLSVAAFASLASGHVIAVAGGSTLHWSPGAAAPRRVELATAGERPRIEMFAPDDAWLFDADGLQHYDGASWTAVEIPGASAVSSLARTADATIWVVAQGDLRTVLYERGKSGPWRARTLTDLAPSHGDDDTAALPVRLAPIEVASRGDTLWITAASDAYDDDGYWALLRAGPRAVSR